MRATQGAAGGSEVVAEIELGLPLTTGQGLGRPRLAGFCAGRMVRQARDGQAGRNAGCGSAGAGRRSGLGRERQGGDGVVFGARAQTSAARVAWLGNLFTECEGAAAFAKDATQNRERFSRNVHRTDVLGRFWTRSVNGRTKENASTCGFCEKGSRIIHGTRVTHPFLSPLGHGSVKLFHGTRRCRRVCLRCDLKP